MWTARRGNNQLPTSAPTIPMAMSPMRPKPQPVTIFPASQPATRPTSNMTTKLSPERFMASFAQSNMPIGRCSHAVVVQQSNWEAAQKFHRDQSKGTLRLVHTLKGQSVGAAGANERRVALVIGNSAYHKGRGWEPVAHARLKPQASNLASHA